MKVGVIGYSAQSFNQEEALAILRSLFSNLPTDSEIVSGYTNLGIPGLAYKVAREFGFSCTGIACQKAKEYQCFPCDKVVMDDCWVEWGDESPYFLQYCDSFIRIGGGNQSKNEHALAIALGKEVVYYELPAL
jgi:hypothetical protein